MFSMFSNTNQNPNVDLETIDSLTSTPTTTQNVDMEYDYSTTDQGDFGDIDDLSRGSEIYDEEYYQDIVSNMMGNIINIYNTYKTIVKDELKAEVDKYMDCSYSDTSSSPPNESRFMTTNTNYYIENGI